MAGDCYAVCYENADYAMTDLNQLLTQRAGLQARWRELKMKQ
jgi:hypothetical protein